MLPSDGQYSYRFNGFTMDRGRPFFIAGVGVMSICAGKITSGRHEASTNRLKDNPALRFDATYGIAGTWEEYAEKDGLLRAELVLTQLRPIETDPPVHRTWFAAVPAGDPDRFWMVSMGPATEAEKQSTLLDTPMPAELTYGELAKFAEL